MTDSAEGAKLLEQTTANPMDQVAEHFRVAARRVHQGGAMRAWRQASKRTMVAGVPATEGGQGGARSRSGTPRSAVPSRPRAYSPRGSGRTLSVAARRAARIASRGAGWPVNCSDWPKAWCISMSKPVANARPRFSTAQAKGVGHGW